jgi:hypothetical protein
MAARSNQRFYLPDSPPPHDALPVLYGPRSPSPKLLGNSGCVATVLYELWSRKNYVWVRQGVASAFPTQNAGGCLFESRPEIGYPMLGNPYPGQRGYLQDFGFDAKYSIVKQKCEQKNKWLMR